MIDRERFPVRCSAAVPAASSSTVPVRGYRAGGETPPELAGEDAYATAIGATL
jgi:hypothetical protein